MYILKCNNYVYCANTCLHHQHPTENEVMNAYRLLLTVGPFSTCTVLKGLCICAPTKALLFAWIEQLISDTPTKPKNRQTAPNKQETTSDHVLTRQGNGATVALCALTHQTNCALCLTPSTLNGSNPTRLSYRKVWQLATGLRQNFPRLLTRVS